MKRPENWEEIKMEHKFECNGNPSVYCGTYAKYSEGSLYGMWIDITTFDDYDEFVDFCKMLHEDEHYPELMFQEYEGFPQEWYSESCLDEETFDKIVEYGNLDEDDREMYDAYVGCFGSHDDLGEIRDKYCSKFDSEEDFAEHLLHETGDIDSIPSNLRYYFDYEKYARDLFMDGYSFCDGYVFCEY